MLVSSDGTETLCCPSWVVAGNLRGIIAIGSTGLVYARFNIAIEISLANSKAEIYTLNIYYCGGLS